MFLMMKICLRSFWILFWSWNFRLCLFIKLWVLLLRVLTLSFLSKHWILLLWKLWLSIINLWIPLLRMLLLITRWNVRRLWRRLVSWGALHEFINIRSQMLIILKFRTVWLKTLSIPVIWVSLTLIYLA